jgi:hypothetical protein
MYGVRDTSLTLISQPFKLVGRPEALLTISTILKGTCFSTIIFHVWNETVYNPDVKKG